MHSNVIDWDINFLKAHAAPPVVGLLDTMSLLSLSDFPDDVMLNTLIKRHYHSWSAPTFKGQSKFGEDELRYYEAIISQDATVPTRERSWHDLFNALVWLQFPNTKTLLNTLHMLDIAEYGVHPRTSRRNRITHFDECGVVLAMEAGTDLADNGNSFLHSLASHEWREVFINRKHYWGRHVHPFIFGHANLEMMLSPFEGLTGKWLAVRVDEGFSELSYWEQRNVVDAALVERIRTLGCFTRSPLLKPIPLLGVPGWHREQPDSFYQNEDYFRPIRKGAKASIQLPL